MKNDKLSQNYFAKYKSQIYEIDHYDDCPYSKSLTPINETPCICYDKQVFDLGRKAERDMFYR